MSVSARSNSKTHRGDLVFPMANGVFGVAAGALMLLSGWATVRSLLVVGCGLALLVSTCMLAARYELVIRPATICYATVSLTCLIVGVVYLTRAANDLPRLLPGYDADSDQWLVLPGLLSLTISLVLVPITRATIVVTS
jgi:hypothetical protein